jgi:hypothetical protein
MIPAARERVVPGPDSVLAFLGAWFLLACVLGGLLAAAIGRNRTPGEGDAEAG